MPFLNQQINILRTMQVGLVSGTAIGLVFCVAGYPFIGLDIMGATYLASIATATGIAIVNMGSNLPNSEKKLLYFHNKIKEVLDEKLQPNPEFFKIGKIIHGSTESTESTKPFIKEESLLNYIKKNFITEEEVDSNKIQTFCAKHSLKENIINYLAETYLQLVALNSKYQGHRQLFDEILLKNKESPSALIQPATDLERRGFLEEESAGLIMP
jgi:hypothetical protein